MTDPEVIGDLIRVTNQAISNEKNKYWAEYDLTATQIDVLMIVVDKYNHGDTSETSQSLIEKKLHLSNATVSGIITRLESKGFLVRQPSKNGTRKNNITIGPRALELNVPGRKTKSLLEKYLLDGMEPEEIETLISGLKKVYANVVALRTHDDEYLN